MPEPDSEAMELKRQNSHDKGIRERGVVGVERRRESARRDHRRMKGPVPPLH
jgi:hypothetical protein